MLTLMNIFLLYSSVFCLAIGFFYLNINLLFLSLVLLFSYAISYSITKLKKRFVLFLFLITFFVFLLGRYFIEFVIGGEWWYRVSDDIYLSPGTISLTILIIYISLICIIFGNWISEIFTGSLFKTRKKRNQDLQPLLKPTIRKVSSYLFIFTYLGSLFNVLDKIKFINQNSYFSYYTDYMGNQIFVLMHNINEVAFFIFLATMPLKKKAFPIIIMYLFSKILTIFTGARAEAIIAILIIAFYLYYREKYNKSVNEKWFSQKYFFLSVISAPFILALLKAITYFRAGKTIGEFSILELLYGFFQGTGGSINLISYSIEFKETLQNINVEYFFGPVINLLKNNMIIENMFSPEIYSGNSIETALFGDSFSHTISYLIIPDQYLKGWGLGSSYIAEILVDFGFIGVIVFNIILGIILNKYSRLSEYGVWKLSILLLILNSLFFISRDSALNWATLIFRDTTIFTLLLVYIVSILSFRFHSNKNKNVMNN